MYSTSEAPNARPSFAPEIEQRLDALARKTGRSKSYYAREAILRQIEDIEDDYLARRRLARGGARVTLESVERDLRKPRRRSDSARHRRIDPLHRHVEVDRRRDACGGVDKGIE